MREFDRRVLHAIAALQPSADVNSIIGFMSAAGERRPSTGSVGWSADRLEAAGLISALEVQRVSDDLGRPRPPRRALFLTAAGKIAADEIEESWPDPADLRPGFFRRVVDGAVRLFGGRDA